MDAPPKSPANDSFNTNDSVLMTTYVDDDQAMSNTSPSGSDDSNNDQPPSGSSYQPPSIQTTYHNEPGHDIIMDIADQLHSPTNSDNNSDNDNDNQHSNQSNPDFSIGSGRASLEMAQYLDHVESNEHVNDIHSFQDVDLDANDYSNTDSNNGEANNANDSSGSNMEAIYARARKQYYLLPMLIKYRMPMMGCLAIFVTFILAVSLSASMANSNKQMNQENAAAAAAANNKGSSRDPNDFIVNDAPKQYNYDVDNGDQTSIHSPKPPVGQGGSDGGTSSGGSSSTNAETGEGEEMLGDPLEETLEPTVKLTLRPTRKPTPNPNSNTNNAGAPSPTPPSSNTSNTASSSSSSNIPKWYTTSHPDYQSLLAFNSATTTTTTSTIQQYHSNSKLFCSSQSLQLCTYKHYCPNGKSTDPYQGGPSNMFVVGSSITTDNSAEWEQWAPLASSQDTNNRGNGWVQVGKIMEGGGDDDGFGRCWTYDHWVGGADGGGAEPTVDVTHLRWVLCCPLEVAVDGGGGNAGNAASGGDSGGV